MISTPKSASYAVTVGYGENVEQGGHVGLMVMIGQVVFVVVVVTVVVTVMIGFVIGGPTIVHVVVELKVVVGPVVVVGGGLIVVIVIGPVEIEAGTADAEPARRTRLVTAS